MSVYKHRAWKSGAGVAAYYGKPLPLPPIRPASLRFPFKARFSRWQEAPTASRSAFRSGVLQMQADCLFVNGKVVSRSLLWGFFACVATFLGCLVSNGWRFATSQGLGLCEIAGPVMLAFLEVPRVSRSLVLPWRMLRKVVCVSDRRCVCLIFAKQDCPGPTLQDNLAEEVSPLTFVSAIVLTVATLIALAAMPVPSGR